MVAVHEIERGRVLIGDAEPQFHLWKSGALEKFVVAVDQAQNFPGEHAGATYGQLGLALTLK